MSDSDSDPYSESRFSAPVFGRASQGFLGNIGEPLVDGSTLHDFDEATVPDGETDELPGVDYEVDSAVLQGGDANAA